MINNFLKLAGSTLAFGAASAAIAVTIAISGLWLVEATGAKQGYETQQVAAARNTGALR